MVRFPEKEAVLKEMYVVKIVDSQKVEHVLKKKQAVYQEMRSYLVIVLVFLKVNFVAQEWLLNNINIFFII